MSVLLAGAGYKLADMEAGAVTTAAWHQQACPDHSPCSPPPCRHDAPTRSHGAASLGHGWASPRPRRRRAAAACRGRRTAALGPRPAWRRPRRPSWPARRAGRGWRHAPAPAAASWRHGRRCPPAAPAPWHGLWRHAPSAARLLRPPATPTPRLLRAPAAAAGHGLRHAAAAPRLLWPPAAAVHGWPRRAAAAAWHGRPSAAAPHATAARRRAAAAAAAAGRGAAAPAASSVRHGRVCTVEAVQCSRMNLIATHACMHVPYWLYASWLQHPRCWLGKHAAGRASVRQAPLWRLAGVNAECQVEFRSDEGVLWAQVAGGCDPHLPLGRRESRRAEHRCLVASSLVPGGT